MQLSTYRKLVRASALYDILITAALATPPTQAMAHDLLSQLNIALGGTSLPAFAPFHIFIAGLLGSVVLVWSLLRLSAPSLQLGRADAATRFLFTAWMAWALVQTGTPLLWLLLVPECAWGLAQAWPVNPASGGRRPLPDELAIA